MDLSGCIVGCTLDGCHRIHAIGNSRADNIIEMTYMQNIICFTVIGTEAQMVKEFDTLYALINLFYILCNRGISGIYKHAVSDLFQSLVTVSGFVTGIRSSTKIGRQHSAGYIRCVALQIQTLFIHKVDDIHHTVLTVDDSEKVHDFGQTDHTLQRGQLLNLLYQELCTCIFQPRYSRYTARDIDQLTHRQSFTGLMHIAYTLQSADIGNLVWICNNRRCTVRNHTFGKIAWCHHGTFDMLMGIDKTRDQISSLTIDNLFCFGKLFARLLVLYVGDHPVIDKDIGRIDLTGDHIDQLYIGNDHIAFNGAKSCL